MQISKFTSSILDIIVIYRSQRGNYNDLNQYIEMMNNGKRPLLIIGDFNFCFLANKTNQTKQFLEIRDFTQIINEPTHIEGHLLDQAYIKDDCNAIRWRAEVQSKYYSDHKGLALIINQNSLLTLQQR